MPRPATAARPASVSRRRVPDTSSSSGSGHTSSGLRIRRVAGHTRRRVPDTRAPGRRRVADTHRRRVPDTRAPVVVGLRTHTVRFPPSTLGFRTHAPRSSSGCGHTPSGSHRRPWGSGHTRPGCTWRQDGFARPARRLPDRGQLGDIGGGSPPSGPWRMATPRRSADGTPTTRATATSCCVRM